MSRRTAFCVIAVFSLLLSGTSDRDVIPNPMGQAQVTDGRGEAPMPPVVPATDEVTAGAQAVEADSLPPLSKSSPGDPKPGPAAIEVTASVPEERQP